MMAKPNSFFGRLAAAVLALHLISATNAFAAGVKDFSATTKDGKLLITASADASTSWTNSQLLIDADGNAKTGYQPGDVVGHGFDIMIEGTTIYRFKGNDPAAWSWDKLPGKVDRTIAGSSITISVDSTLFGDSKLTPKSIVMLRALSADYQKVIAASDATAINSAAGGSEGTRTDPAAFSADITQDQADLMIKVTAKKPADLDTVLIFFDTDCDHTTGFQPPADPHFGFEEMIQGESLFKHEGEARDGWNWKPLGAVKRKVDGSTAEYRFNASLLNSTKIKVAVWQMSPDWQTRVDRSPADEVGTVEIDLDKSKLHAAVNAIDLPMATARVDPTLPTRQRFADIKSYACYYGKEQTANLSHYDAVILHTPAQTAKEVRVLNNLGVVTIGYLTIGEDDQLQTGNGQGPGGKASWYFDKDNQPEKNGTWNSWYANAGDPLWRANRISEAKNLCDTSGGHPGFQGIFLDTVETCDSHPQSRAGMIQLIKELREALPDKVIVINRGFSLLKETDVSFNIDGLMFESFSESYDFDTHSYIAFAPQDMDATRRIMDDDVLPAIKKHPLQVLALDYCEPDQVDRIQTAFDRAATFGMIPTVSSIYLDAVYDTTHVKAVSDPKYLTKLATPASLTVTLNNDQNGFPAGTTIEPSSCFLGYTVAAVVDGIKDRSTLPWSKAAWASAEESGAAQQLELSFPQAIDSGHLKITFAFDNGKWKTSRKLNVESKASDTAEWQPLPVTITEQSADASLIGPAHKLRITQAAGDGCADRPDLMWIAQIELVK